MCIAIRYIHKMPFFFSLSSEFYYGKITKYFLCWKSLWIFSLWIFTPKIGKMGIWVIAGGLSSKCGLSGQAFHRESMAQELLACPVCFPPSLRSNNNVWLSSTYSWVDIKGVPSGVVFTGGMLCITHSLLWMKVGQLGWSSALLWATVPSSFTQPPCPAFCCVWRVILWFLPSCRFWRGVCRVRKVGHSRTRWILGAALQERAVWSHGKTTVRNSPPRKDYVNWEH